jgi:hypothetical protein
MWRLYDVQEIDDSGHPALKILGVINQPTREGFKGAAYQVARTSPSLRYSMYLEARSPPAKGRFQPG